MRVSSVNTGRKRSIAHGKRTFTTGICKEPAAGPVYLGAEGVNGDNIADLDNHGGADQAVYAYSADDYEWWSTQLGREVPPGTFGENLTIEGMPTDMNVGDRLLIGDVLLEATAPRIPCSTWVATRRRWWRECRSRVGCRRRNESSHRPPPPRADRPKRLIGP